MAQNAPIEEPIAIVGSACRFPGGANSPSKLWDLLENPRDVLKEFNPELLNLERFHHDNPEYHGSTNVINKSYVLEEDTRVFDARFFGVSPMEAATMDPQQRQLLETVYESFESAGMTLEELKGSLTSVHVGTMTNDWTVLQLRDTETLPQYTATGTSNSIVSNRISYVFDLKGPSVTIDTACSSSLVALHQAARGLLDGDSEIAVVAGVNIILDPTLFITESKLHMLSPEARSRMWDEAANGYARGEGTASIILKPLSRAIADGDAIEGIVRSTGVNSDGQSPGITMPFAPTQTALIRQTYRRAGLDPLKDPPQYFECHGTGTPAGDPVEARAVSEAFVAPRSATNADNPLLVGSIKTVVGHLEGCAGLAGVLKVLLAIKHRVIPPNLLFNKLNPAISPYYGPLQIPTKAQAWPELPPGTPARASVNSFGFGGTNAHAIIESFEDESAGTAKLEVAECPGPLLFSAASEQSLLRNIQSYLAHLKAHPEIDLKDLSWLLQARRSTLRVRAHFSGPSRPAILRNMENWVSAHQKSSSSGQIGHQPRLVNPKEAPGTLAVFTGQGAQWPEMGRELLERSPLFRRTIEECQAVLQALPASDRPAWSLIDELKANASVSRLREAALSQPACTAIQVGLFNLLQISGIRFAAAVGHSSGEIAAAYASGILDLAGAMQIAYYRGFHSKLAGDAQGQQGGMMAVGLPLDKAILLCGRLQFEGRLRVAASNAPQSVTLSGDIDAIHEAKSLLDADGVFARLLQVDTAYHSHHMLPCADAYLKSLLACNIQIKQPGPGSCVWSSSVRGDTELLNGDLSELKGSYWVSNMVQPVLFAQAVESSIWHGGPFDVAIEVGPHPALKGPVEQTLKASFGSVPLYTGVLKRGMSDVEAFASSIGAVWSQLGPSAVNFPGYHAVFQDHVVDGAQQRPGRVLKGLPSYAWDHDQIHWRESALSRRFRTGRSTGNDLLGRRAPDDNERELRWRNVLRLSEMPWLRGHVVFDQVLLPGATYVSLAIEAGRQLAESAGRGGAVAMIEVEDVDILRPVVVPDDKDGVESLFTMHVNEPTVTVKKGNADAHSEVLRADFSYYVVVDAAAAAAASSTSTGASMIHTCTGKVAVHLSTTTTTTTAVLPPREATRRHLIDIDCGRVYAMFAKVGLKYTGPFQALTGSSRSLGYATGQGTWSEGLGLKSGLKPGSGVGLHPAHLDVAFQTLLIARAHPSSGHTTAALLPSHIDRVRFCPSYQDEDECAKSISKSLDFESWAVRQTTTSLVGDINIYNGSSSSSSSSPSSQSTVVQVEGLVLRMIGEPDPSSDRPVFAKTVWARDVNTMGLREPKRDAARDAELLQLTEHLERVALFYARRLAEETAVDDKSRFQWYHRRMLDANNQHLTLAATGRHPMLRKEWLADGPEILERMNALHGDSVQLQMLHAVGNHYPQIVRGKVAQLQVMTKDDLLNRFFMEDLGCLRVNQFLADAMCDITFKYPRCNILEIGAGTGGTTWAVLNAIGDAYASYTFTDISSGFLPAAASKFADFSHKMLFKTLNVETDPASQDYVPYSYDIIIAANVLHATANLERTMHHVRSLLRPGGYLLLFETTGVQNLSIPFIFSGLPSWWPGEEPERLHMPIVPTLRWDAILQDTGFSGLDTVMHDVYDESKHTTALLVTQAVDDTVLSLRRPIAEIQASSSALPVEGKELLLIGGKKFITAKVLKDIQKQLPRSWRDRTRTAKCVDDVDEMPNVNPGTDIICLHDLDEPIFSSTMASSRLAALQSMLMKAHNLLWVTSATTGKDHDPRATMIHGVARVVPVEMPHLHMQVLGLESGMDSSAITRHCLEAFLRLRDTSRTAENGQPDVPEGILMWAREPELEVVGNTIMIPRVVADQSMNDVYIASKRTVTKVTDATDQLVQAVNGPSKIMLQAVHDKVNESTLYAYVQVDYTLHIPDLTGSGDGVYLVCGRSKGGSLPVIAFSKTNASPIFIPPEHQVTLGPRDNTPATLISIAEHLFDRAIFTLLNTSQSVLLHGVEPSTAERLAKKITQRSSRAFFVTSDPQAPADWIKIHPQASKRVVRQAVPRDITVYMNFSQSPSAVNEEISDCLGPDCKAIRLDVRLLETAFGENAMIATTVLNGAYHDFLSKSTSPCLDLGCKTIPVAALTGMQVPSLIHRRYVTDWRRRESLPLTTKQLDVAALFRSDKTYLMVGAAGGLGFSICKWALANGAKHMVITSRNPRIDSDELEDARRLGATLQVLSMDVTDMASVTGVRDQIRKTMPPIAGLCNAAMVLSDKLFLDMSDEQLNGTLAPKVDGSEILDAVFGGDADLDFFVMLSSSATVLGNIGQANYHVANLYMGSLAARRRARGLPGSIIHVGHITDVGYVVESKDRTASLEEHFRTIRLMPLSETDVHHAFAEAIRGGRPGGPGSHDIIMGVEPAHEPMEAGVVEATDSKIPWLANPRLSHLVPIANQEGSATGQGRGTASFGSLKQLVLEAETEEQAIADVLRAFCAKLEAILQLSPGQAADNVQAPIIDMGIDSLVAVEIRTWFLKELAVEVPVLKILGGDSAFHICTTVARAVMAKRIKESDGTGVKVKDSASAIVTSNPAPDHTELVHEHSLSVSETEGDTASRNDPSAGGSQDGNSTGTSIPGSDDTESSQAGLDQFQDEPLSKTKERDRNVENEDTRVVVTTNRPEVIRQERMSRAQARIWFLSKHLDDPTAYNMVFHYRVHGPLNLTRLRHALQVTTNHHGCLRMCFFQRAGDGHAMQGLMASSAYEFRHVPEASEDYLSQTMENLKNRVWDLESGQTFNLTVLSREPEVHDFVIAYHHIVTDVVGLSIFLKDLDSAYRMQPLDKSSSGASPLDYAVREAELEASGGYGDRLNFWCTKFETLPEPLPLLPLSSLRARPTSQRLEYNNATSKEKRDVTHSEYRTISPAQAAAVKAACAKLRISAFHFHLAVLQILLAMLAQSEDVCIGVVDANRGNDEASAIAHMVGCFVNVLPIRARIGAGSRFNEVARTASREALSAFAHAGVPFDVLLDTMNVPRWTDGATSPLFQAAINYRGAGWGELPLGDSSRMSLTLDDGKDAEPPYDVSLGVMDIADGRCALDLHCQASLYNAEATSEMIDMYLRLVEACTSNLDMSIDEYSLYHPEQISHALALGKGLVIDFGWPATLPQRFRDIIRLYAAEPAITDGNLTLTYAELTARVNAVSQSLAAAGCIQGDRVASLFLPSVDSVVSMLAILQAGYVYVPLDTNLPVARMAAMAKESQPSLLLCHKATKGQVDHLITVSNLLLQVICVDKIPKEATSEIRCIDNPAAAAILLFTSGSTGKPKGIILTHGNFVNHVALKMRELGLHRETVLQQSSLGFDMSVIQTFCALADGGRLVVVAQEMRRDPIEVVDLLCKQRVSLTIATPSEYLAWMRSDSSSLQGHLAWKHACMGGEHVSKQLKKAFHRLGLGSLRLTNCYGPTEITAAATFQTISLTDDFMDGTSDNRSANQHEQYLRVKYAVGKALPNYTLRILDAKGRPQAVQHTGEICIGGSGVAMGYLGLPNQTKTKFITDPSTGERLYRTGDLGRLSTDGTLLCFGRIDGDTQVKVRGLRVELQEVETAVLEASRGRLAEVVVLKQKDSLFAYASVAKSVSQSEEIVSESELMRILADTHLPQYFVPAAIFLLPTLPTNSNGKLDRRALAEAPLTKAQGDGQCPEEGMNIREGEVRLLWERVLPTVALAGRRITPSSDFFLLGGNSMLLMRLQAVIKESMGIKISTRALYRNSALSAMAQTLFDIRDAEAEAKDHPDEIDWAVETAVPDWVKSQVRKAVSGVGSDMQVQGQMKGESGLEVILTGATSFFGGVLLEKLLESAAVSIIHCVAVPADDKHLLPQVTGNRIRSYTGSLSDTDLGISPTNYARLAQSADVIIHAGANGHCLNNYATLRTSNVVSTQSLAALALQRPDPIPLLFLSSNRVALVGGDTEQPPASLAAYPPPTDGTEGYTLSKWASEVFLENMTTYYDQLRREEYSQGEVQRQQHRRWAAAVHRPCIMVGSQAPNSDSMNAILRYSLSMRCVPRLYNGRGFIDFTRVENVAEEVMVAALRLVAPSLERPDSSDLQFRHHSSGIKVPVNGFAARLEELYGGHFDAVEMRQWIKLASAAGIDPLITAYLDAVLDSGEEMIFPYLGAE